MSKHILGVLCSGRGSNLQSIMEAIDKGQIKAELGIVLTDKPEAKALERAEAAGIIRYLVRRVRQTDESFFRSSGRCNGCLYNL